MHEFSSRLLVCKGLCNITWKPFLFNAYTLLASSFFTFYLIHKSGPLHSRRTLTRTHCYASRRIGRHDAYLRCKVCSPLVCDATHRRV